MNDEMGIICKTLQLNTRLCINCFKEITHEEAISRVSKDINSMSYLLVHMLDARYFMARLAGVHLSSPYKDQLKSVNSIDEYTTPPPTGEVLEYWRELSDLLCDALTNADETDLKKESKLKFPIDDKTKFGGIVFLTQHDSYHLGQLSIIRKQLGHSPVSYE